MKYLPNPSRFRSLVRAPLALLLLASCLAACAPNIPITVPTPITGALPAAFQVYFTSPIYPDRDPAKHTPSLDAKLTDFINTAQQSVDIAIYQLDLPNVTKAL